MANLSFFTLFFTLAVVYLALTAVPSAHALTGMNLTPPTVKRAENVNNNHHRMIRKRQTTAPVTTPPATTPPATTPPVTTPPTTPAATTTPVVPPPGTTTTPITTGGTTTTGLTSTTSGTSTITTQTSTSTQPTSTATSISQTASRSIRSNSVVLVTTTEAPTSTLEAASNPDASFLPKPVIIGLIVTASCIAAGAAIWTIIRKWKFSPSRHFEDRLEPVNWEPTQASGLPHDPTVAALERASSRTGSGGARSSLGSHDEHGGRNMTSVNHDQISMAPDFPPAHDFTATGVSGYGGQGAGYVDMHRGPSPAPGAYGAPAHYETPNPYDGYDYGNPAYGQRRY